MKANDPPCPVPNRLDAVGYGTNHEPRGLPPAGGARAVRVPAVFSGERRRTMLEALSR